MTEQSLILVVNPGSTSRKYALFAGGDKLASVNFEFVDNKVFCKVSYADGQQSKDYDDADLSGVSRYVLPLLHEFKVINENDNIDVIGIRLVAPSKIFAKDELVTDEIELALEAVEQRAPLHVKTVMQEVKHLRDYLVGTPIVIISDSAFHASKPDYAWQYGIDLELAEKIDVKRYGYHGISVGSVVRYLDDHKILSPKTLVCHLGGGCSITALKNGKSIDNTMGYTPLEGVMMASRSGNIDVSAALAIKRELKLSDDDLEKYLNKQSGLLGVSGSSSDIRQLIASEEQGDDRARLALSLFVYRIQQAIGQMAASLGGADCLIFTATVGERSSIIRSRILEKLGYLGFVYDQDVNNNTFEPTEAANIAVVSSKPVFVISTDEAAEIARRAEQYMVDHN
jgi:acetate kinase